VSFGRNDPCPCGSGKKYKKCCAQVKYQFASTQPSNQAVNVSGASFAAPDAISPLQMDQLVALFNRGNFQELEVEARNLLQKYPNSGHILKVLGAALQLQGKDGILALQQACTMLPGDAEAHNNLGVALKNSGRLNEAAKSLKMAVALQADFAEAHNNLGMVLRDLDQIAQATLSYRRAVMCRPNFAEAHNNLGNALRTQEQIDEAIESYRRALEIKPDFAEAHLNLGIAYKNYDLIEAERHCRKALEINPNLGAAITFLADLFIDHGKFADAEECFQQAIMMDPEGPEAWALLPRIRKLSSNDAAWLAQAQKIADKNFPPRREVYLRFAIGKYYDDVKEYDHAFSNYRRANELMKASGGPYDRKAGTLEIDHLISYFDHDWLDRHRATASNTERPVFIIGMPRSGTSLAEQIIASHPQAFGAGELPFWKAALTALNVQIRQGQSSENILTKLAVDYLQMLQRLSVDALRVVDKMPVNFMCVGLIHAAMPNARIIHMQRNPIDTCLSIYFQHFDAAKSYGNDLEDLVHYYKEYRRVMAHWRTLLPKDAILDVPYENLVDDQEGWSRKMLDFIGLPWDPHCINFHETVRTVKTASNWQVRQKINKSSVERWRNYQEFVTPLLQLTS